MRKIIIPILLLSSCYTAKKANKQIAQAQAQYPEVVRGACVNYYPSKDSISELTKYIQGRTDTIIEMVENVVIDSVQVHDTIKGEIKIVTKERIVKVPVIKYLRKTDTLTKTKIISYENTAVIDQLNDKIDSISEVVITSKERLKIAKKRINSLTYICIILAASFWLYLAAKKYFKK